MSRLHTVRIGWMIPAAVLRLGLALVGAATALWLTDVQLCVFPQDGLWNLFHQEPKLGYDVTWLCASEEQLVDENLITMDEALRRARLDGWHKALAAV